MIAQDIPSEAEIIGYLNTAVSENNYDDLIDWSDADIAMDLVCYCPGMEHLHPENEELLAAIAAWRKQLKPEQTNEAATDGAS